MYGYNYNNMMDGWNSGYSQGDNIVTLIFMSVMMILFIILIVWAVRFFSRTTRADDANADALELLKKRYAAGEIDSKQFEQIKKDLNYK